jgi:hypothetical protein
MLLTSLASLRLPMNASLTRKLHKLQQQLQLRLQQVWPDMSPHAQVTTAHAAGRSGFDLTGLLQMQQLLPTQHQQQGSATQATPAVQQEQQQRQVAVNLTMASPVDSQQWAFASAGAASHLLWVFGNVARHPGPQVLGAALAHLTSAASAAAAAGAPLPIREISAALYAVAVLQELQNPATQPLVQLLQQAAAKGELLSHPEFTQVQAGQLAACLLAAQDAAEAGPTPLPAPVASYDAEHGPAAFAAAKSQAAANSSPWLALPVAVQQRLLEAWRRKVLTKANKRTGMGEHMLLVLSLRQLGLRGKAKAVTDDGHVCIDVAITTHTGEPVRAVIWLHAPVSIALNITCDPLPALPVHL